MHHLGTSVLGNRRRTFSFPSGQVSVFEAGDTAGEMLGEIFEDMDLFRATVPTGRPLIGLDLGTKTIGVAVSDVRCAVASPLTTIRRTKSSMDADKIRHVAGDRQVAGIVLGLPKNMNGTEGPRCQSVRAFAKRLAGLLELPVAFWDERLSTVQAERSMLEGGLSRRRRAELVNHVAASIILQGALDRMAAADSPK